MKSPVLNFEETMAGLPPQQPEADLDREIAKALQQQADVVIVLDDDPTGTQTVYDIPVITEWSVKALTDELLGNTPLFYVLTNSRALNQSDLQAFAITLGNNIRQACNRAGKTFLLIFRGDSTLRGHYPLEESTLRSATGMEQRPHFLIPAFFEGGRYTIGDVHYAREGDRLVPAAQTPFAQDAVFAYQHSDLKDWVEEKSAGSIKACEVVSLSLLNLRSSSPAGLQKKIESLPPRGQCIVNAADYTDLKRAALAILRYGQRPMIRSAASFVRALLGLPDRPLIQLASNSTGKGGLIVVGSHVPKTTDQLRHLQQHNDLAEFEVDVPALVSGDDLPPPADLAEQLANAYGEGRQALLYTSREVVMTTGHDRNIDIAATVSAYLEAVVAALPAAPAFLVTKGGITSSRIITESLGVKRALVLGQVLAGVPTWELGPESKFPGLPFVIFPGNVGDDDGLTQILKNFTV